MDVLSHLSVLLMDPDFTGKLREAETVEEFKKVIEMAENEPEEEKEQTEVDANVPYVLAVTGCPTGIAHTYMAAEALERKAEELGYQIKVETRGSSGAKNVLTAEEIAKADGIIVAADTKVPMERFDGKPVIITKVADGINKPEELIRKIVDKQAPVYESEEAQETVSENTEKKGIGHASVPASDEWSFSHVTICYRWWYHDGNRLFDRYSLWIRFDRWSEFWKLYPTFRIV